MVDVNVEFTLGNDNPINAEFTLEPDVTYLANIVTATFSGEHNQLIHREYPDQHPIEAITGLTEGLNNLSGAIDDETARAENAENILNGKIDDEISRAILAEGGLSDRITSEVNRAKGVEERLSSSIDSNHQAISNHVADKNNPHEVTKTQVGLGNVENLSPADMPISTATQTAIDTKVDKVSTANKVYGTDDSGNQTTYNTDSFGKVDDVRVGGTSVVTNKIANLGTMAGQSAESYSTTAEADALYATAAQGELANTAIQPNDNISLLTNNSNYQTGTQVANSIAVETAARENADNNLQSQIDAITSSSDVTDIVGTYAQLQAYDTSSLPPNSIIKVLQDESRNNETTYYRWVITGGVGSWVLIGEEGPYYTKSEANSTFVPQTRTVNNKTLSNDITLTAADVGALPSSTVIPTVNNATLTIQKNGSTVNTFTANASTNVTANITVPTKTSDITNDSGFITNADLPTNHVTTDTNQTITGLKTFTSTITYNGNSGFAFNAKHATAVKGTTPTSNALASYSFVDKNFSSSYIKTIARTQYGYDTAGTIYARLQAFKPEDDSTATGTIAIYYPSSGDPYTEAPTPTQDTTSSTQIDTVGARNTKLQNYALSSSLATVATSGSYNDLSDKPTIPTKTSDLTNDSGYITGINSSDVTTALGFTPADSTTTVNLTGNQTVAGTKTFTNSIVRTTSAQSAALSVAHQYTTVTKGTAPTGIVDSRWRLYDKNGTSDTNALSGVSFYYRPNGEISSSIIAFKPELNSSTKSEISITYPVTGDPYTSAPTPATSDNSTKIATTAYVQAQGYASDSDVVKLTGDQTIAGTKTYTSTISGSINGNAATVTNGVYTNGNQTISGLKTFTSQVTKTSSSAGAETIFVNKNTSITKGTPPSANVESRWRLTDSSTGDSNSAFIGGVTFGYATNMRTSALLQVGKPEAGSTSTASMGIYYTADGDAYTSAPTPATSDNSTKIATTAFVKNQDYAATRYVDGMVGIARYATSTTAAATVEKVVSIPEITSLNVGQCIIVQPTITSTVADSTIKLNDFTAYPMRYNNAAITTSTDSVVWNQNYPTIWMFDGTYWVFIAHGIDSNTTYSAMSVAEGTTGTATSNRVMRADYLKQILDNRIQLVSSLPATPESNILYCIPES
jgi:hypothetical protein